MRKIIFACGGAWIASCLVSCNKQPAVVQFEPNMVFAKAMEIESGYPMGQALTETQAAVTKFFGTPDEPKLPEFLADDEDFATLISLENLKKAAGAPTQVGRGLYRQHCATCHGVVGNGRGETAALLVPYPRDYRMGKFKFKSTTRGAKPLREDLAYSIKHGIVGTSMKVIPELSDEDINALVDYVIYLSIRGEFERDMIMIGSEIDFEADEDGQSDHLFDENSPADDYQQQLEDAQDVLAEIVDSWLEAKDRVKSVPEPEGVPVPDSIAEVLEAANAPGDSPLKQSIAKGKELFLSEAAACAKCHGKEGHGDGQTQDYDDWTKDWTVRIGVDPTDFDQQVPLIARGALPPLKISPRNFSEGAFRGGDAPEQLYRRISVGIEGTPMPAPNFDEQAGGLKPNDVWHLVNYVRSLAVPAEENTEDSGTSESAPAATAADSPAP